MTEEQLYLFDSQGFLVVKNALSRDQLDTMNAIIDSRLATIESGDQIRWGCDAVRDDHPHDERCVLSLGAVFRQAIDNPVITPILQSILGSHFRLDHDYLDVWQRRGAGPIGAKMHGGAVPWDPAQYYYVKGGRVCCGLVAVLYNLYDVDPREGGFACVPGSHKSNFPLPKTMKWFLNLDQNRDGYVSLGGEAGSAIIFTEALMHGARPWTSDRQRRSLFYKYNNRATSWSKHYYDANRWENLTDRARMILAPPNARHSKWL